MNSRGCFWRLRDPGKARAFDDHLLTLVKETDFRIVAIVIDKLVLKQKYPAPAPASTELQKNLHKQDQ